jgi:replicative DNA helicase
VATDGRTPPYNQEAEAAVLGGILLNNEALHLVQPLLGPDDFYVEAHRRIYESMASLSRLGLPIDHVTLGNELKKRGDLDKIGGAMALASLTDHVATIANVEHYATIVREKAAVRRMIYAAQEVVARGYTDYGEAGEFLNDAESAIFKASQQSSGDQYTHVSRIVEKTFRDLEEAAGRTGEITGIPTGFTRLDKMTAGLQRSDLIIVAGRPAMGKTSFALSIGLNAAKLARQPVIVFSLEMSKDQLVRRLLTSEGRVDATKMRSNRLDRGDWPRLVQAANDLSGYQIYLDDSTPMTPVEIRAKCRRLLAEKGLCLVIVDYLQLMHAGGRRKDNREQEISEISRSLKGMAKELNVPVMALSQLNRSVESRPDKRPMMSDLRESGAIEQDADIIMFVYRDEVYTKEACEKPGVAEIIIGKQRSGPTGIVETRFFNEYTRFDNLTDDEPPEGVAPPPGFGGRSISEEDDY